MPYLYLREAGEAGETGEALRPALLMRPAVDDLSGAQALKEFVQALS
jgi:hypothetical protein